MRKRSLLMLTLPAAWLGLFFLLFGCETGGPTEATIANEFPGGEPTPFTVVKVWYRSTLYLEPLAPGQESEPARVATGAEPVYALLARVPPGGNDGGVPRLVAARTREEIAVPVGERRRLALSPTTTLVGCGGPDGLSQADYEYLATRIFPGDAIEPFDPAGCSAARPAGDAAADGSPGSGDASGAD